LKRNYESVSYHSAVDSVDNVRLNKMKDEYDNQIKALQFSLAKYQDECVELKAVEKTLSDKQKELLVTREVKNKEIENLKKELAKQQKIAEQRLDQMS